MAWIETTTTRSGLAAPVGHGFLLDFVDTECKISKLLFYADALGPAPSYVEDDYVEAGYDGDFGSGGDAIYPRPHGTVLQDPLYLPFVNKGYTRDHFCDPHEGGEYTDEVFPHSEKMATSLLNGKNMGAFGSKRRSTQPIVAPNTETTEVVYNSDNMSNEFI